MYECYFSGERNREKFSEYYNDNVKAIQRIVKLYGSEEIRTILETTCLRNKTQRGYKIRNIIRKSENKESNELLKEKLNEEIKEVANEKKNDNTSEEKKKPNTRSNTKKC